MRKRFANIVAELKRNKFTPYNKMLLNDGHLGLQDVQQKIRRFSPKISTQIIKQKRMLYS